MPKHPDAIEGPRIQDWEPLGQVDPKDLPEPSERYPGPWETNWRGNGHVDVSDAKGRQFAHVYLWEATDSTALLSKVQAAMEWAIDGRLPLTKEQALGALKRELNDRAEMYKDDSKMPMEEWRELLLGGQ